MRDSYQHNGETGGKNGFARSTDVWKGNQDLKHLWMCNFYQSNGGGRRCKTSFLNRQGMPTGSRRKEIKIQITRGSIQIKGINLTQSRKKEICNMENKI